MYYKNQKKSAPLLKRGKDDKYFYIGTWKSLVELLGLDN